MKKKPIEGLIASPEKTQNIDIYVPRADRGKYRPMLQGTGTNQLTRISTRGKESIVNVNGITGVITITKGTLKVTIEPENDVIGAFTKIFDVSTHKLFDACVIELTKQNHYRSKTEPNAAVVISLEDYMKLCGIPLTKPSKDKIRRNVKTDLDTLLRTRLEWTETSGKKTKDYLNINICSSVGIKNGNIILSFTPEIARYLVNSYVMQYPIGLLKIDERNPNAYYIGKKLLQHYSIDNNIQKDTANIISVRSLLEWCEDVIPSYEEVMSGNRHLDDRIITPLENALTSLQTTNLITWEYCNSKKTPLTDEQLNNLNYYIFIDLYIHFEVNYFPNQTQRLKFKKKRTKKTYRRKNP